MFKLDIITIYRSWYQSLEIFSLIERYIRSDCICWNDFLYYVELNVDLYKFKSCKNGHIKGIIFYSTAICNPNIFYLTAMNYDLWMKQKNFLCIPFVGEKYIKLYSWSVTFSVQQKLNMKTVSKHMGKIWSIWKKL